LQQPVSVGVDASSFAFQNYKGGIFTNTNCGTTIDHAILAVGWGNDSTYGNYWIVENQWGTSWGDNGYILIQMTPNTTVGICGINQDVGYPYVL
jgi:cathepsin L